MARDEQLVFSGLRWSAARIESRHQVPSIESVLRGATGVFHDETPELPKQTARRRTARQGTPCMIFSIEAPGGGRSWEATEPQAFWRNFAALDFIGGDGADVLRFV
jgi:hypothetical protein